MEACRRCQSKKLNVNRDNDYHDIFACQDCKYLYCKRIVDCCRKTYQIIAIDYLPSGQIRLYKQCLECGGSDRTKPLNQKSYQNEIRTEFSLANFRNWHSAYLNEGRNIYDVIAVQNYSSSKYKKYQDYLKSDLWKKLRDKVLERDNYLCQSCRKQPAQEVHHLRYDNLYCEPLEDLQSLCQTCHRDIHEQEEIKAAKQLNTKLKV